MSYSGNNNTDIFSSSDSEMENRFNFIVYAHAVVADEAVVSNK